MKHVKFAFLLQKSTRDHNIKRIHVEPRTQIEVEMESMTWSWLA